MTATSRIGDPMTYDAAYQWLTGGKSPAGMCSATRARTLLSFATDAGAAPLTVGAGPLNANRVLILTFDGTVFEVFPATAPQTGDTS